MIELKQRDDAEPLCPHCTEPVRELWFQELRGFLGRRYVYFCSNCRNVIGISHRKGLWMG